MTVQTGVACCLGAIGIIMSRLSAHGEPVADYVRRSAAAGESRKVIYRLMSDGELLHQTAWTRYSEARTKQMTSKSDWKIAKVTTAIKANPDLLLRDGFQKRERYPTK